MIAKILWFVSKSGFLPQCRKFNYFNLNRNFVTNIKIAAVFWRYIAL